MRKLVGLIGFLSLILMIGVAFACSKIPSTGELEYYESRWGLQLPLPDDSKELWASEPSFHGDGEWFSIFYYDDKQDINDSNMTQITEANINAANGNIKRFIASTTSLYYGEDLKKIKDIFEQYPVEAVKGDYYYYYQSENGGTDYFIAIFKKEERQLYTFRWHQ